MTVACGGLPSRAFVLAVCLTVCTPASAASAQVAGFGPCEVAVSAPDAVTEVLDRFLISLVDPDGPKASLSGYAPGAVLSVVGPDWRYNRSAGQTGSGSDTPMDCAMPFQIGSNTKMMTATVLLQLHEEGALSIDDRLAQHLPEIAAALPHGAAMTLRQLATHTSGIFSYTDNAPDGTPGLMEGGLKDPVAMAQGYAPKALVDFAVRHGVPEFPPGEAGAWSYSNTGYVLLGLIIEKTTGKPLADVFEERIFTPLQMADTFLWNDIPQPDFGLPSSYWQAPFTIDATQWNLAQAWAAGGVISTADDMTRFIRGLFEGRLFAKQATLELMEETVPTGSFVKPDYGIGLIEKQPGLWGHGGQTLGFASDVAYFTDDAISVVVWTTSANSAATVGAITVSIALQTAGVIAEQPGPD